MQVLRGQLEKVRQDGPGAYNSIAEQIQEKIDAKNRTLRETQAKVNEAQKQISDVDRTGRAVADSFESGMVSAFEGVITGTQKYERCFQRHGNRYSKNDC